MTTRWLKSSRRRRGNTTYGKRAGGAIQVQGAHHPVRDMGRIGNKVPQEAYAGVRNQLNIEAYTQTRALKTTLEVISFEYW